METWENGTMMKKAAEEKINESKRQYFKVDANGLIKFPHGSISTLSRFSTYVKTMIENGAPITAVDSQTHRGFDFYVDAKNAQRVLDTLNAMMVHKH